MIGFDPRPRERATLALPLQHLVGAVSIRAPVRGRPETVEWAGRTFKKVSIRAPVRERHRRSLAGWHIAKFRSAPP